MKNLVVLADHDCGGFDGCQICTAAFLARSRQKWNRFLEKMELVRNQNRHINAQIVAAVMSPEENQNAKH